MQEKVHTTLNLSGRLIGEAKRLFQDMTKTEIIHEALRRMIQTERLQQHVKKWKKKGSFESYE